MQILLANAKIMREASPVAPTSVPHFQSDADYIASQMASEDVESLCAQLHCDVKIAAAAWRRFRDFSIVPKLPAIMAYNGQAYKYLKAETMDAAGLEFAQSHLWITSFMYGLLRPMDGIAPYRMEPAVTLPDGQQMSKFWRDKLTDMLIDSVVADDGILLHLSTAEYEQLFDWKRVCRQVRVVQPLFYVRTKGVLKVQAVWAKSCRGAMTRFVIDNRINLPEQLRAFSLDGFQFQPTHGDVDHPYYIK